MKTKDKAYRAILRDRLKHFRKSKQLSLGDLIRKIEAILANKTRIYGKVKYDFCDFYPTDMHSWRGAYQELALNYENKTGDRDAMKPLDFLNMLKSAIGRTFEGWKGGDFVMTKNTPVWVSEDIDCDHTAIIDVIVETWGDIILVTGHEEYLP